jgi:cell wall-associated NlpC family hydrolase
MIRFYDGVYKNAEKLKDAINSWVGASYLHGAYKPFTSVDCVHFVQDVYWRTGAIAQIHDFGKYPVDWYLNGSEGVMREAIEKHLNDPSPELTGWEYVESPDNSILRMGDIVCLKINSEVINHVGVIMLQGLFAHASTPAQKVVLESISAWKKHIVGHYRLYTEGN